MFHNIMLGRYYMTRSKVHEMNPISKILCIFIFIIMAFVTITWELNLLLLVLTLLFLFLTNIPIGYYVKTTKILIPFYVILFFVGFLFQVSVFDNLLIMLRITMVILYITMLTLTTPITEIIYGLEKIFSFLNVFNINVPALAFSISESLLLIPNMIDEGSRILKSGASRGVEFGSSNLKGKFLIVRSMMIQVFLLTVKKSEDFKNAMSLRLYSTSKKRTNFRMNRWGVFDSYMVMMYLLVLMVIIKKEIIG